MKILLFLLILLLFGGSLGYLILTHDPTPVTTTVTNDPIVTPVPGALLLVGTGVVVVSCLRKKL